MSYVVGECQTLIVKRETDISYTLTTLEEGAMDEIFLHFNQTTRLLNIGEKITAFLYYDQKHRLCATMETPLITTSKLGFVKVCNVLEGMGCFMSIGICKDILLSSDFLPINTFAWPKIDDELPCILKVKKDQLVARPINHSDDELIAKLHDESKAPKIGQHVEAIVTRLTTDGLVLYTKNYDYIFVHHSLTRKKYHLGEVVTCQIINQNDRGEWDATCIQQKAFEMFDDAETIRHYLQTMGKVIPLGNKSTPEEITKYFQMSKSAFKRAVGTLYKNREIEIEDNQIRYIK